MVVGRPTNTSENSSHAQEDKDASSKYNGRPATDETGRSQEMSQATYKFLLEQMETLRQENSSLKAGLKSNTSHITKLESEALRMKDMVLMLGSPSLSNASVESEYTPSTQSFTSVKFHSDHTGRFMPEDSSPYNFHDQNLPHTFHGTGFTKSFDKPVERKRRSDTGNVGAGPSSHHLLRQNNLISPQAMYSHESFTPSPSNNFSDVIRNLLASMKEERISTVKSLILEEQKKEFYMRKLQELTSRFDSDKFSKPNDEITLQLEHEIAKLKRTMEISLGSSDAMQERLDARLKHIQFLDSEIANLEQLSRKSDFTFSPVDNDFPRNTGTQAGLSDTGASCIRHGSFHRNGVNITEISTQTSQWNVTQQELRKFDESQSLCEVASRDASAPPSGGRMTRSIQTMLSTKPGHGYIKPKHRHLDSIAYEIPGNRSTPPVWMELKQRDSPQSDFDDTASMHSFTTSLPRSTRSPRGAKKDEMFVSLLAPSDREDMTKRIMKMGETIDGCRTLKQLGYMRLIIQIMHDGSLLTPAMRPVSASSSNPVNLLPEGFLQSVKNIRMNVAKVLWNIVNVTSETKSNRDFQIFQTLEVLRRYCELLFAFLTDSSFSTDSKPNSTKDNAKNFRNEYDEKPTDLSHSGESHISYDVRNGLSVVFDPPINEVTFIMKLAYDENIKRVINEYGGLYAIAELFILHYRCVTASEVVGTKLGNDAPKLDERTLQLLRRFIGFALINLTFGDIHNKTALIQMPGLIDTIILQMALDSEEMQQVMALFVRNLCWQADEKCREILKKKDITRVFTKCALKAKREDTLKSLLSALWNLSGHCSENRHSICTVKGSLAFLVSTLISRFPDIVESGGGILRNVSSVVATNNDYRTILREQNCLQILLKHLKSGSLTIVSNACGTLWNLSARNAQDQKLLRDIGAVPMLKSLTHSKHSVIAQGSNAALRNLLARHPGSAKQDRDEQVNTKMQAKRHTQSDLKEDGKGYIDRDFSQHGSNVVQRIISSQTAINSQRHSLQEKSTFSPPTDLEARLYPNRNYPGSLTSLPYSEFGDSAQKQNPQSVTHISRRNGSSFQDQYSTSLPGSRRINDGFSPIGSRMSNDVKISNDKMPTSSSNTRNRQTNDNANRLAGSLSLRDYFIMIGENKSLHSATGLSPNKNPNGAPVVPSQMATRGTDPNSLFRVDMNDLSESFAKSPFQDGAARVPDMQKLLGQTRNPNVSKITNVIGTKCPEDLVMSLYKAENDYGEDDGLVNYSLQFRDEHMTPGIRSPRTEEIYELAANPSADQSEDHPENYIPNRSESIPPSASAHGPSAKSEGGLSALSSCVDSTGSSVAARPDVLKNLEKTAPTDMPLHANFPALSAFNFHGEHKIDPSSILVDDDDDKPTDFSALYSEEQLFDSIEQESLGMKPYNPSKEENFSLNDNNVTVRQSEESREKKGKENAKAVESREEDDKVNPGAITPGRAYHYRSGRTSGIMTPRTPLEYETPMMFSRSSSLDSVSTVGSIHSSITSGPTSRMMSGAVSPSHLPDSPSQSMPISPRRTPPPQIIASHPADVDQQKQAEMGLRNKKLLKSTLMSTPLKETEVVSPPVGGNRNKTVTFLSPGYVTSLPHTDELNIYKSEGAMSVMTTFSALTIDSSVKVQPTMCDVVLTRSNDGDSNQCKDLSKENANDDLDNGLHNKDDGDDGLPKEQVPVIGYVTSLPTSDEIMTFMNEGTLSPMTVFSEITCIKDDNDGFQKTTGSVFSVPHSSVSARAERAHSVTSNKVSIPSRSSATGESAPQDSPSNQNVISETGEKLEKVPTVQAHSSLDNSENSPLYDVRNTPKGSNDIKESDSDDSLSSCSDDDDDLLQQCINQAIPKKVSRSSSRSSKHSSKNSKSSRSKDKSTTKQSTSSGNESPSRKNEERAKNNPSPVVPDQEKPKLVKIQQRIESANMKLKGISIVQYMDNLIGPEQTDDAKSTATKSNQAGSNAENSHQSYSVKKKLKEYRKKEAEDKAKSNPRVEDRPRVSAKVLPVEPPHSVQSKLRVHSYLKEGMTSYATEGTPIEMSRSTSLSNITIESDGADADNTISQMKTSISVPDITSVNTGDTPTEVRPGVVEPTDNTKAPKEAKSLSRETHDGQDILDNLGKQIENMRIATAAGMLNTKKPGYTTSIPEVDEIRKYHAEGSICGATEFSALTVDSDTKIAPLLSNKVKIFPNSPHTNPETGNTPPEVNTTGQKHEGSDEVDPALCLPASAPNQACAWENEGYIHPSGHYNDGNDNLSTKEERHNYMNEDTPLYLSGGSLSSLEFGSDDDNDLLNECISSALPPEKATRGQSYMGASAVTSTNIPTSETVRLYSHGAPDGKVDDALLTNSNYGNMQFAVPSQSTQFQRYRHGFPSSVTDQMNQLHRNAGAANLMHGDRMPFSNTPNEFAPSGIPASASYPSFAQPSDLFHHIQRQPTLPDSELLMNPAGLGKRRDVVVGQSQPPLVSSASISNQRHGTVRTKNHSDRAVRATKKHSSNKHDVDSTRRRMQAARAVDSSSGSSASYRQQQRHRHLSSNSRSTDVCGCHTSHSGPSSQSRRYNRGSTSTSTSQFADDMRQSSRSRMKSSNSTSKNSMRGCDHNAHHHHHHHPPKASRPRNSAKNVYRPGIVQLYPPLKDMVGVLEGVASVAARGDKVVADRTQQYSMGEMSIKSSSSSLVRSATFINEKPSDILLENMSQEEREQYAARSSLSSRSQTQTDISPGQHGRIRSVSPRGSIPSLKQSSQASIGGSNPSLKALSTYSTKPKSMAKVKTGKKKGSSTNKSKPKKVWIGIKKLLSPSDENSLKVKEEKSVMPDKALKTPLLRRIQSGNAKPVKSASSIVPDHHGGLQPRVAALNKKLSNSSLSLTSSSDGDVSSGADSPPKINQQQATPFGHLPKSPSVNALMRRQMMTAPQSLSVNDRPVEEESSVWRRTNLSVSGIPVANGVSSQQSCSKMSDSLENHDLLLEQNMSPNNATQPSPNDIAQVSDQQKVGQTASNFNSPSRTLSPRVVQEVAPFNYKPTQRRIAGEEGNAQSKAASDDRSIGSGCKQTPL